LFKFTSDPRDPITAPQREQPPLQLNFAPLLNALDSLNHAALRYEKAYSRAVSEGRLANAKSVNERLIQAERALTSTEGLKNRSWYVHMLYAPGFYTGYGVRRYPACVRQSSRDSGGMRIVRSLAQPQQSNVRQRLSVEWLQPSAARSAS